MRKKIISGLILVVVLSLVLISNISCRGASKGGLAAIVNGKRITLEDLEKEYKKVSGRFQGVPQGALGEEQKRRTQKQLLFTLMERILLDQQAKKEGIKIKEREINTRYNQFQTGRSKKEFKEQLKKAGLTENELKERIRDNLVQEKLRQKVVKAGRPTEKEIKEYYRKNKTLFTGAEGKVIPLKEAKFRIEQLLLSQNEQKVWNRWLDEVKTDADVRIYFW